MIYFMNSVCSVRCSRLDFVSMELQVTSRNLLLFMIVIVIHCQTSTTWADDSESDSSKVSDSSEEVAQTTGLSAAATLFSKVATTRRHPRNSDAGCGQPQPVPCPKKIPVCAGTTNNYNIYENECVLNQTRCDELMEENLTIEAILNATQVSNIGNCQKKSNASQLTCEEILWGWCPQGTMSQQVCDLYRTRTYKNVCRVLHRRCKKEDDTCYNYEDHCPKEGQVEDISKVGEKDCSKYILRNTVITSRRPCYTSPTSSCRIKCRAVLPAVPEIPAILQNYAST